MTKQGCIINPQTGRAVKTTTALGKKLMAQAQQLDDEYKGEKVIKTAAKRALAQKEAGAKKEAGGVLAAAAKRAIAKKPEPPKPAPKPAPKPEPKTKKKKEEASKVLQGAVKRTLAKKPEPPKPAPKKYGWEDLDDGVKDMISGIVKKNEYEGRGGKNVDDILKYIRSVSKYYELRITNKKLNDMDKSEIYNFAYKGELDEMVDDAIKVGLMLKLRHTYRGRRLSNEISWVINRENNGDVSDRDGFLTTYTDYGDNLKLYNYLINHPVNRFTNYKGSNGRDKKRGFMIVYFSAFIGDDVIRSSNNDEYEILTLVETKYINNFIDKNGKKVDEYTNSASIPLKVFRVKVPKNQIKDEIDDLYTWGRAFGILQELNIDYNYGGDVLEYKRPNKDVFQELYYPYKNSYGIKRPLPNFKKP